MHPVKFDDCNVIFAKNQKEYSPLPAFISGNVAVFCWKLSLLERLKLLFTGKIWHSVLTFKQPLQPQYLSVNKI